MSDQMPGRDDEDLRLEIDPEPSPEEFVAILEVVRAMQEVEQPAEETDSRSNWERTARREALRPAEWPPQRFEWAVGRR